MSYQDIARALDDSGNTAASHVASAEAKSQLREQKEQKKIIETGFADIQLGKQEAPVDLKDTCLWVPASIRHDVKKDEDTGQTRYSFFAVYGGVSANPRMNIVRGGNAPLSGNPVGRAAFNNVNAQAAMNMKMRALEGAQREAVRTQTFSDGRVRYYRAERSSATPGPTRGAAHVTEHNPKTGQVRTWMECYDHGGKVNRVHPKTLDGQNLKAQHYPPTKTELEKSRRP